MNATLNRNFTCKLASLLNWGLVTNFLNCRDTIDTYSAEVANLAMKILDCMAKALNIDTDFVRAVFGEGRQSFRMNYYPPCPQPDKVIGLTPHSDSVALTILLQLNDMEGLQIKKDGKWVPVKPLPHAFVVNIGDILEVSYLFLC